MCLEGRKHLNEHRPVGLGERRRQIGRRAGEQQIADQNLDAASPCRARTHQQGQRGVLALLFGRQQRHRVRDPFQLFPQVPHPRGGVHLARQQREQVGQFRAPQRLLFRHGHRERGVHEDIHARADFLAVEFDRQAVVARIGPPVHVAHVVTRHVVLPVLILDAAAGAPPGQVATERGALALGQHQVVLPRIGFQSRAVGKFGRGQRHVSLLLLWAGWAGVEASEETVSTLEEEECSPERFPEAPPADRPYRDSVVPVRFAS